MRLHIPARAVFVPPLLLFLIGLSWGLSYVWIKIGVSGEITPLGYVFWFAAGAGTVLAILCALRRTAPRMTRAHLRYYLMMGAGRIAVANFIFYSVQQKLPVGLMAVVMTTVPMFTYGMSLIGRLERFAWLRFAGIVCGFSGVLLIVAPRGSLPDPSLTFWVLLGFGAPFLHALGYILISERYRPEGGDSLTLAVGMFFTAALVLLPVTLAAGQFHMLWPPFSAAELALCAHMAMAGLHFYAIFELIRIAGATYMSQANFLAVGFGVVFGVLIFGETHSLWVWASIAMILVGVALVNARQRQTTES
jgi:drug/metabolite transporter (DMT)-like permease